MQTLEVAFTRYTSYILNTSLNQHCMNLNSYLSKGQMLPLGIVAHEMLTFVSSIKKYGAVKRLTQDIFLLWLYM